MFRYRKSYYLLYAGGANTNSPNPNDMPLKLLTYNKVGEPNNFLVSWESIYYNNKKIKTHGVINSRMCHYINTMCN